MKNIGNKISASILLIFIPAFINCQDADNDGINDNLEQALAERFAPEWRFHREGSGSSNQNENEEHFPSSIEWFYNYVLLEQGEPMKVGITNNGNNYELEISDINNLDAMIDPISGERLDAPFWDNSPDVSLRLTNFPEKINGRSRSFSYLL